MKKRIVSIIFILFICVGISGCTKQKEEPFALIGDWQSEQGTLITFDEDGNYGYYKDGSDRDDNFYKGTYTYQNGEEAMKELGVDEIEFKELESSQNINKKDIFAVKMNMEILHSNGTDKSTNLNKDDYFYFVFYRLSDDGATAVNLFTYDQIELERLK